VEAQPVIELLDTEAALRLPPQPETWAEFARQHVVAMLSDGIRHYVDNVDAGLSLLRVDEQLLPIVVARRDGSIDRLRPAAAVVSPRSHYVDYTREELAKRHPDAPNWLLALAFWPLNTVIRVGELGRVVHVNNWLLTTNPTTRYTETQLSGLIDCLTATHPTSAIVFRGLMTLLHADQIRLFRRAGFRLVRYRRVWIVEDCERACHESPELRRDLRLLKRHGYEVVDEPEIMAAEAERLADLYRDLYLGKHSRLNPHFNAEFIRLTLREGLLTYRIFRKDDSIDAVKAWYTRDGLMTGAFVGHDRRKPRAIGLYRQAMALQFSEAARLGFKLHLSGGAGEFKRLRGATPHEEYEAVWDRHLSPRRRLPWAMLEWAGRAVAG